MKNIVTLIHIAFITILAYVLIIIACIPEVTKGQLLGFLLFYGYMILILVALLKKD